jgi:zinc protease
MFLLLFGAAQAGVLPTEVQVHELSNGLTVYLAPMDTPGVVAWQTWMEVGVRNETADSRGYAHLQTRLLDNGSATLGQEQYEEQILLTGAEESSWSWLDNSVFHITVPSEHLPTVIMLEANRFLHLDWDDADLDLAAGGIQGSHNMQAANPVERLTQEVFSTAFSSHPYGWPALGYAEDIQNHSKEGKDIRAFYDTWYRPSTTRIVVAGDFDVEATLTQIQLSYGVWPEPETAAPPLAIEPEQKKTRRTDIGWTEGAVSPRLMMGWKIPGFDPEDKDSAAIQVVQDLLFSEVADLRHDLVDTRSLIYGMEGGSYRFADAQLFMLDLEVKHKDDLKVVEKAVLTALGELSTGVQDEQLVLVRGHALAEYRLGLDNPYAVADTIGRFTYGGRSPEVIDTFFRNYAEVTAEDVARVVQTWFRPEGLTVGTLIGAE